MKPHRLAAVATAVLLTAGLAAGLTAGLPSGGASAAEGPEIHRQHWSFGGMFGSFDKAQLQRGFQVYTEVCSTCHSVSRLSFRNLAQKGGPEFPEASVKALAASTKIQDGPNDEGKMFLRPGRPSDRIPGPYKNEQEARSVHNGALPPDLSLIAKARGIEYTGSIVAHPFAMLKDIFTGYQEGGQDYIYAVLTGYRENPPGYMKDAAGHMAPVSDDDIKTRKVDRKQVMRCVAMEKGEDGKPDTCTPLADFMNYNEAFPGHQIAMVAPLTDGRVAYTDGTPNMQVNYAADVVAFLSWAADPTLDERKHLGWQVLLYLAITSVLLWVAKRKIWAGAH